jgi:hypothetical protein
VKISRIMAALPIAAALFVALPTTSDAQGWGWRAGKWVYEVAKDSRMLAPGAAAGAGSVAGSMLSGSNAKADDGQVKLQRQLELDHCLKDDGCRQSLGLSRRGLTSNSGLLGGGTPEEQQRFFQRFNAPPPPGSAAKRLLEQSR